MILAELTLDQVSRDEYSVWLRAFANKVEASEIKELIRSHHLTVNTPLAIVPAGMSFAGAVNEDLFAIRQENDQLRSQLATAKNELATANATIAALSPAMSPEWARVFGQAIAEVGAEASRGPIPRSRTSILEVD